MWAGLSRTMKGVVITAVVLILALGIWVGSKLSSTTPAPQQSPIVGQQVPANPAPAAPAPQAQAPAAQAPAPQATAPAPAGTCTVAGSVYVEAVKGCVLHVTDVAEINKATPADTTNDPNCKGKPPGFRYDTRVTGPDGAQGIAHHVCGSRPKKA